jgi:hypothetical protein
LTAVEIRNSPRAPKTSARVKPDRRPRHVGKRRSALLWGGYAVGLALIVVLFIDGFSFYTTPYVERPHHPDYRALRPAGTRGLLCGIVGTAMMLLMLVYSLRKRTRLLGRTASLRPFLDFHIFLGVVGPLFIVLHTSFKVQGLVAVSFWSMVAVALSGFFGRYLYLQIPRNIQGKELTLHEIERLSAETKKSLQERFDLDDPTMARLERIATSLGGRYRAGPWPAVLRLLGDDLSRFQVKRRYAREVRKAVQLPQFRIREFVDASFERALLERRIASLERVQRLFHYWHVIHKPFAIIMYVIVGIHVGVALWTGYGWFG